MVKTRIVDFIRYWYFYFPKWVWTVVVMVLFVLFNLAVMAWMPETAGFEDPIGRLFMFYIWALAAVVVVLIVGFFVLAVAVLIYDALPDDPRKKKDKGNE